MEGRPSPIVAVYVIHHAALGMNNAIAELNDAWTRLELDD